MTFVPSVSSAVRAVGLAVGTMMAVGAVQAQGLPDPLLAAVQSAVTRSPDVQERWRALLASEQPVEVARAGWRPQVDALAGIGRQRLREPSRNLGWFSIRSAELTLTQLVFDGGVASSFVRQTQAAQLQAYFDLLEVSEGVAFQVFRAYADVLRQRELLALAASNVLEHKALSDMLQERVAAAVARGVDFQQASGRLALAESTLVEVAQALHNAETRYHRLVGTLVPGTLPPWPERLGLDGLPGDVPALLRQAYGHNPSLRAAAQRIQGAREDLSGREAALYMPRVELAAAAATARNTDGVFGRHEDERVELVLRQNLYRGGGDMARKRRAEADVRQADALMDNTCRTVRQAALVAYKDVLTLVQQAQLEDQRLLMVDRTRVAFRQQFDIGQRTLLDLLDTQREFFEAQTNYTNTRYDQLIAQARTLSTMGQLIASLAVEPGEWAAMADALIENDAPDPVQVCPPEHVVMDSLDRIKASLEIPARPARAANTFVVLIPNDDGAIGAVVVGNAAGQRVLDQPLHRLDVAGNAASVAVSETEIQRDFGAAMGARPALPRTHTVFFRFGAAQLTAESEREWATIVESLRQREALDITVAGHTDTVGSDALNERLGMRRAQEIVRRLRASGVEFVDVAIVSFGERQPLVQTPNNTQEPRNRRVEITAR